ncbi:MAG TPA: hypothetical protein VJH90_00410 [archaeon]|nr:hypothetical protein [archaeon]
MTDKRELDASKTIVTYMLRNPVRGYSVSDLEGVAKIVGWEIFAHAMWRLESDGIIESRGRYHLKNLEKAREFIDGFS